MTGGAEDPDATVRLHRPAVPRRGSGQGMAPPPSPPAGTGASAAAAGEGRPGARKAARRVAVRLAAAAVMAGLAIAAGALWLGQRGPPPGAGVAPGGVSPAAGVPAPPPAALPGRAPPQADAGPPLLGEAEILAHRAAVPTLLRLAVNPRVFVLDFPDLASQGAALNRVAALVEKAGLPRDRLLTDSELAAAIARSRDTPETWYYGHDYRGRDLERFFALADRDGIALNPLESWVRAQFEHARRLVPEGEEVALISIAAPGPRMTEALRAAILRHEIGHGHFFTLPAYAAHVRRVWREGFTEAERAAFRRFLGAEGYDTEDEDLMMNEAQAYLIHTPDPQIFNAGLLGLPEAQVARMRALMRAGAPAPF
ncbi:hypothetical protein [Caldovatus aquaticus]|uniref:Uncharacterized protein n=1 Tax=Caldovatus aquaticus TaxID=2865671 RepID=A0ABS7F0G0_9PROT|nr:hypothetical protein [Caldovatus aquaticus]MBW8268813.1 hypothetical protein [Caldovatus aquaticus]